VPCELERITFSAADDSGSAEERGDDVQHSRPESGRQ
jgi:hypothetical protein